MKPEPLCEPWLLLSLVAHCSKLEIVLNENDTPQNQQFLLIYTLVLPKESRLQNEIEIDILNLNLTYGILLENGCRQILSTMNNFASLMCIQMEIEGFEVCHFH